VVYVDLDHFKAYNDTYGYAGTSPSAARPHSPSGERGTGTVEFIGHIGGTIFFIHRAPIEGGDRRTVIAEFTHALERLSRRRTGGAGGSRWKGGRERESASRSSR
jgi:hypothetical protein